MFSTSWVIGIALKWIQFCFGRMENNLIGGLLFFLLGLMEKEIYNILHLLLMRENRVTNYWYYE